MPVVAGTRVGAVVNATVFWAVPKVAPVPPTSKTSVPAPLIALLVRPAKVSVEFWAVVSTRITLRPWVAVSVPKVSLEPVVPLGT